MIAALLSFVLTGSMYLTTFGFDARFWPTMVFAIVVPWGISIPLGIHFEKQRTNLADITDNLKKAQDELHEVNKGLQHKANFDSLTGLFNRGHFIKQFERRRMTSDDNVLLIVDADHFKDINDFYGHPVGDEALKLLSSVFKKMLRKDDLVGRIGGEEFGILLPATTEAEGEIISEMIRHEIESTDFKPQSNNIHRYDGQHWTHGRFSTSRTRAADAQC